MKIELVGGPADGDLRDPVPGAGLDQVGYVLHVLMGFGPGGDKWWARYIRDGWTCIVAKDPELHRTSAAMVAHEPRARYRFVGYTRDPHGPLDRAAGRKPRGPHAER